MEAFADKSCSLFYLLYFAFNCFTLLYFIIIVFHHSLLLPFPYIILFFFLFPVAVDVLFQSKFLATIPHFAKLITTC